MAYTGFAALSQKFAKKGIRSPDALAAVLGRKKFGKKKFQKAAASGTKMRGMKPQ